MHVVTEEDLQWWFDLAPTLWWKNATETSTPHSYIVLGPNNPLTKEDYVRIGGVIRTFGQPGKFSGKTNIYLTSPDGQTKWWTEDRRVEDTDLVNTAPVGQSYGVQDAQPTATGLFTKYDAIANCYDRLPDFVDEKDGAAVRELIRAHFGLGHAPNTLDVGCGTGRLLELKVVSKKLYVAVDSSQGMLNELAIKHGNVGTLVPKPFGECSSDDILGTFELVVALFGTGSYLTRDELRLLQERVRGGGLMIAMFYQAGYLPSYYSFGEKPGALDEPRQAMLELPGDLLQIGHFDVKVWAR